MNKIPIYNQEGKLLEKISAPADFNIPFNQPLVKLALLSALSYQIPVTAKTKTRGERRGGGVKPWRQKGTGKARAGSMRSPLFRKGGITFGPTLDHNPIRKITKKAKKLAIKHLLIQKVKDSRLIIVSKLNFTEPKTKKMEQFLTSLPIEGTIYLSIDEHNQNICKSAKNIAYLHFSENAQLKILTLAKSQYLILTKVAYNEIINRFTNKEKLVKSEEKQLKPKKLKSKAKQVKTKVKV